MANLLNASGAKQAAMTEDARSHHPSHPAGGRQRERADDGVPTSSPTSKGQAFIRMLETLLGADKSAPASARYHETARSGQHDTADCGARSRRGSGRAGCENCRAFTELAVCPYRRGRECVDGEATHGVAQDRFTVHDPDASPQALFLNVPPIVFGPISGARPARSFGSMSRLN